jgi:PAS domain S-box-containing protein
VTDKASDELRVLVVDDNPRDLARGRGEVARVLPAATIVVAGSAEEVEAALGAGPYGLAILDYSLGWTNGARLLERIRQADPAAGAILFTGSLGDEVAAEAMRSGFDDYVLKSPEAGVRLGAAVERALERVRERRSARAAEARYQALVEAVSVGVFACRPDGRFVEGNRALLTMLGVDADALKSLNLLDLAGSQDFRNRWLESSDIRAQEVELTSPDGRRLQVLIDAYARDHRVDGLMTDVTALREAVRQKDMLLREVFHRVYNNLQQVEALLNLQGRRFSDPEIRRAFKDVGDRLRSLALVQQKLYQGDDYRRVNFAAYLRDLAGAISAMARRPEIQIVVEAEAIDLDVDRAVPLGLIANELLTNAVKHAFGDRPGGRIDVRLVREARDRLRLEVRDDGTGADPQVVAQGAGLGARLIPNLARQLGAELTVENVGGLRTTVIAPL